jgi:cell division protein FtsI (penicillin-binding protein 3)
MRALMRLVVRSGTGRKADARGYLVGGKTGTAEKQGAGGYRAKALISSFVGTFPADAPRFVVLALLDEPKGNASTHGYATGGWVAAPVVGRVVARLAPLLGMAPVLEDDATRPGDARLIAAGGGAVREPDLAAN